MKKAKKHWVLTASKIMPSDSEKIIIIEAFTDIVSDFRKQFVSLTPNKNYPYLVDIHSKWYRNFFYLCEQLKSEHPERIADEFERKFVRLEFKGKESFDFSYFRHTGVWHLVAQSISLAECKKLVLSNPNFQPLPIV